MTNPSGIKVNFFSKIARGVTKRTHIPASNFVQSASDHEGENTENKITPKDFRGDDFYD